MEMLLQHLDIIYELLEQVEGITANQTTILLQCNESPEDQNQILDILDNMVNYKEDLTNQLVKVEEAFQEEYAPYKGKITDKELVNAFKHKVNNILLKKQAIVDAEKKNVMIMQLSSHNKQKVVPLPKQANQVVAAYKKQQTKNN